MLKLVKWLTVAGACALPFAGYSALRTIEFEGVVVATSGIGDLLYPIGSPMKSKVTWDDAVHTTTPVFPDTVDHRFLSSTWEMVLNATPRTFSAPLNVRWSKNAFECSAIFSSVHLPLDKYDMGSTSPPDTFSGLNYNWDELNKVELVTFQSDFIAFGERGTFAAQTVPESSTLIFALNGIAFWVYARRRVIRDGKRFRT